MKHGNSNRRQRSRNSRNRNSAPNRSQVFDSNGPEVRIRGTAHQIVEKYAALAKDAASSGDHPLAENYLQHAEHYQRIINVWDEDAKQRAEKQAQAALEKAESTSDQDEENQKDDLGLPASMLTSAPVEKESVATESEKELA